MKSNLLKTFTQICGAVGGVLLLSTPLSWLLTERVGPLVIAKLAVGLILLVTYALTHTKSLRQQAGSRSSAMLLLTAMSSGLVVTTVFALNLWSIFSPREIDFTREEIHSLSPQTNELLARLAVDVDMLVFYAPNEPQYAALRERLDRYDRATPRLRVQFIDPNSRPELVERWNIRSNGPRVVVYTQQQNVRPADGSEQELTGAIMRVAESAPRTVYFVTGHGERDPTDNGPDGLTVVAQAIAGDGYGVAALRFADNEIQVPQDAAMVVIAGSTGDWLEGELRGLEEYLEHGGRAVFALEPNVGGNLLTMLRPWKIGVQDDIIADSVSEMMPQLGWAAPVIQPSQPEHEITQRWAGSVVMRTARSIQLLSGGLPRVSAQALVQTGRSAWGETNLTDGKPVLDSTDHPAPLVVGAVAVSELGDGHGSHGHAHAEAVQARIAVFGDTDWLNNRLAPQQGNLDLFMNTVNWLAEQPQKITIRPRGRTRSQLALAPKDITALKFFSMDVLPVFLIALGVGVVSLRRR